MRLHLIAVGERMPAWVADGYRDYAGRLPAGQAMRLIEVPAAPRRKGAELARIRDAEGERLMAAVPPGCLVVALDRHGAAWSTEELADRMRAWRMDGRDVALLVGGPEGLAGMCLARADATWSLSRLTFPHALVRVIVAEQLYRAWSMVEGRPYHR